MPAHPKPPPKAKKPGAMRSKPKTAPMASNKAQARPEKALDAKRAIKAPKVATAKAAKARVAAKAAVDRATGAAVSKTEMIIGMLKKPAGATSKAMEAATGWAPHSVRGLLGTLRKRGTHVISTKEKGELTVYSIPAPISDDVL